MMIQQKRQFSTENRQLFRNHSSLENKRAKVLNFLQDKLKNSCDFYDPWFPGLISLAEPAEPNKVSLFSARIEPL